VLEMKVLTTRLGLELVQGSNKKGKNSLMEK
jgi:hypothetical protein